MNPTERPLATGEDTAVCVQEITPGRAGLYVDLENLQGDSRRIVQDLIENWTDKAPTLSRLGLYVRADQMELWRLWATSRFTGLEVRVNGTQNFNRSPSKNSADISISVHAMADLTLQRITHVVVFSEDSDFISLYAAIRDEPAIPQPEGRVPFTWVVTDREGSLSTMVKQFFPEDQLHTVTSKSMNRAEQDIASQLPPPGPRPDSSGEATTPYFEMARVVVETTEVGRFKSTDCQDAIRTKWPKHPLAKAGGAAFGTEFRNKIWPILERWGVRIANPGKKPVRYEMIGEAKTRCSQDRLV